MQRQKMIKHVAVGALAIGGALALPAEGDLVLTLEGDCPGLIEATVTGATPDDRVAVVFSTQIGRCMLPPQQPCGGHYVGLSCGTLRVVTGIYTDENGDGRTAGMAGAGACGGFLQAIDLAFCTTSNIVRLD